VSTVVLLGPQRFTPTLGEAVSAAGVTGELVSVTAGWQEREAEDLELHEHLGERTLNLMLYARAEDVFERDPDLFAAHRERQQELRELQRLYRGRLAPLRDAARRLLEAQGDAELLEPERTDALATMARLDAHHLTRVDAVNAAFEERWKPADRPAVQHHVAAIRRLLDRAEGVAIAGGHVAILLNRLRLFAIGELIGDRALFAWSAGAMALAERVVLFHDTPPQGEGVPEVLERGLGRVSGLLPLPHARRRLLLDDPIRVRLFAGRFAPDQPLAFDDGARWLLRDGELDDVVGVHRLGVDGTVVPVEKADAP